jgi:broad specificity phosphatase PhoE
VWEEELSRTRARYQQIVKDLADKYPTENLLLVTHGMYHIQILVHQIICLQHLKATLFGGCNIFPAFPFDYININNQSVIYYFVK